ncbi:hypothetical protein AAEU42_06670 [Pseudoflavonifractor phocaeensis]|uniref:hypothetical protein n=1 Tax=Pseudoflavonifractor phocaeensis TaxID=1870988 RepID=UPI003090DEF5|nr:hypothetical protein CE91St43_24350 [Oscillospiraceae bacterium]
MRAILEIVLSLLAVMGLLSLGWILFGHILTPAGGGRACCVVPGTGDGGDLEQAVTGVLWLRGGGLIKGTVVIADCGLNAAGKAVAAALTLREPGIDVCPAADLPDYIREKARGGH